jgi:two-component system, chemotaxis family, sensor kinase CheA
MMQSFEEKERMREAFQSEAYTFVGSARSLLEEINGLPIDSSGEIKAQIESLFELTLTFKQNSNLAGLLDVSNLAFQFEAELERVQEKDCQLQADEREMLLSFVDSIETFLNFYFRNTSNSATLDQLLKSEDGFQMTAQFKELFLLETREHLTDVNTILLNMESHKVEPTKGLEEVYRLIHSIKGDSNALGFEEIGEYSHSLESYLSTLQSESSLESSHLEQLFAKTEELSQLLELVESGQNQTVQELDNSETELADDAGDAQKEMTALASLETYAFSKEIKNLYLSESQSSIAELDQVLNSLADAESSAKGPLLDAALKITQTLRSKSRALGISPMDLATGVLEKSLRKQLKNPEKLNLRSQQKLISQFQELNALLETFSLDPSPISEAPESGDNLNTDSSEHAQVVFDDSAPPSDLEIPEEVKDIFLEESLELIDAVKEALLALKEGSMELDFGLQEIYRAVHTLKGNSNALGVAWIGDLAGDLETQLREYRDHPEGFQAVQVEQLRLDLAKVEARVLRLQQLGSEPVVAPVPVKADYPEISIAAYLPDEHAELPEEVRDIYLTEAQELIETVSQTLLDLEQEKIELIQAIEEIYRAVHTLKGNSNALGVAWIGKAAHDMETFMSELREYPERFEQSHVERLFKYLEVVRELVDQLLRSNQASADTSGESKSENSADIRRTIDSPPSRITLTKTPQQAMDAVRRQKSLFDEFEQKISSGSGSHKLDLKTTQETKKEKLTSSAPVQSGASQDETIRVGITKVDKLINLADELLINKIAYEQRLSDIRTLLGMIESSRQEVKRRQEQHLRPEEIVDTFGRVEDMLLGLEDQINGVVKNFKNNNGSFSLLVDEIQYNSRTTRMLPASNLVSPLRLVVRNTSAKLGKKVKLQVIGEEIELDRLLIEKLKDPLAHILRNALDHGIELPDERKKMAKEAEAMLSIAISLSGNNIVFQIHDDGRGIDFNRVREKAVRVGLATHEQAASLTEHELSQLLFTPGFSTADQVTDVSGRGVGLDVVKNTIEALNGTVIVVSEVQRGTIFTLSLPVTLTTFDAFLVNIAKHTFALPRSAVLSTVTVKNSELADNGVSKAIYFDGAPIKLVSLKNLLRLPGVESQDEEFSALVVESNRLRFALVVDEVLESQQMVMKNLGSQLQKVSYISGATLMGSGEPVVILNIAEIVSQLSSVRVERLSVMVDSDEDVSVKKKDRKTRVLVVDDSVTTRTLEKNILEAAGFEVFIGKNGLEGKQQMLNLMPDLDLVITDVEMPKMNGYQFASWIKKESDYRHLPVIMVTSLATDEFKAKGYESGIDAYIVKGEFNQKVLLETISRLLAPAA